MCGLRRLSVPVFPMIRQWYYTSNAQDCAYSGNSLACSQCCAASVGVTTNLSLAMLRAGALGRMNMRHYANARRGRSMVKTQPDPGTSRTRRIP